MTPNARLAILGTGNIGRAMAVGLVSSGRLKPGEIILTRRRTSALDDLAGQGYQVQADNPDATRRAEIVIVAVEPHQLDALLEEIAPEMNPERHLLISVVSGASIAAIQAQIGGEIPVIRAMPNTAIGLGRSMTCMAMSTERDDVRETAMSIFDSVGKTLVVAEEQIVSATALCACGVAFFLRAVRAASQGGIEIGFHPAEALTIAAQTALGAASLIIERGMHPEHEIDSVTTPRGCTIAGLNEMEHRGFSSALIRGIVTSADKAGTLYSRRDD